MFPQWGPPVTKKNVAFKIRVNEQLKKEFLDICSEMDIPAAQVVRELMRKHVEKYKNLRQQDLFDTTPSSNGA